MSSIDPHSTTANRPTARRRRRLAWITIATAGVISVSALLAVPAIAADGTNVDHSNDRVIVCESGVETNGDVSISSATATRLPEGDTSPVPTGCREG